MANPNPPTDHLVATQWAEGQSGNPAGKPPGTKHRATVLRELMNMMIERPDYLADQSGEKKRKMTVEESVIQSLIMKAFTGDVPAIKEAQDTLYGKISDKVENLNVSMSHDELIKSLQQKEKGE